MMIRTGAVLGLIVLMFSCNNGESKTGEGKEDAIRRGANKAKSNDLIYLDTAMDIRNILSQGWVMEDDADALEGMDEDSKFEIPYRSFYFSTGGSFVKNPRNAMEYGSWRFDEASKTIFIKNTKERGQDIYKIARLTSNELVMVNVGINSVTNLKFIASEKRLKNENEEPFLLDNNRWRIKPKAKESDAAIHQRLKENVHFFILFYKSVLTKEDPFVSFWGLPSCYAWYGGGISLKKPEVLPENWIACFYNKEQAMKAYSLADRLLRQKYEWPKGETNWLKLNLAILEQMYQKIDEIH